MGIILMTMLAGNAILGNLARTLWMHGASDLSASFAHSSVASSKLPQAQSDRAAALSPKPDDAEAQGRHMRKALDETCRQIDKKMGQATIIVTLGCCVVGYLMALATAGRITRPLMLLSRAANEIADGRFGKRVSENAPDEIGDLAVTFNRMTQALEHSREDLEQAYARMELLATQDGLTGLANRRTFQERLAKEWERAAAEDLTFSLILLDVDKFKTYNDTYGHLAGDAVLQSVGALLQQAARDTDLVARYGGEEFVVILTGAEAAEACRAAERFRAAIEGHAWPERPVTISLGVASLTSAITDGAHLIAAADEALYKAKSLGRNRVVHGQIEVGLIAGSTDVKDISKAA